MNPPALRRHLVYHAIAAAFMVYVFALSLKPLSDPDFWFHLRAGQWMAENHALVGNADPFSYTTPHPLTSAQVKGLRSQWAAELVSYMLYAIGGYASVAAMRSLLIVLPFAFIYLVATRRGAHPLAALALAGFAPLLTAITLYNTYERPQGFSFVLAVLLIILLERMRQQGGRRYAPVLPLMMVAWSNLHGGYIIGFAIIAAYAAAEAASWYMSEGRAAGYIIAPSGSPRVFLAACVAAMLMSGLNPGGYRLVSMMMPLFKGMAAKASVPMSASAVATDVTGRILEYQPLWFFTGQMGLKWPYFIAGFYAACTGIILSRQFGSRRMDAARLAVVLMVAAFGVLHARGVGFALIVLSYYAAASEGGFGPPWRWPSIARASGVAIAGIALVVYVAVAMPAELVPRKNASWIGGHAPDQALSFLREQKVKGPMFNHIEWGGYLIWAAYPEYRVFFDGREVSTPVTRLYMETVSAMPGWQGNLDAHGVNFLLLPVMEEPSGVISPIVVEIEKRKDTPWRMVYLWDNVVIYVRDSQANRDVIKSSAMPDVVLYDYIMTRADAKLGTAPGDTNLLITKALVLHLSMRNREALDILRGLPRTPYVIGLMREAGAAIR